MIPNLGARRANGANRQLHDVSCAGSSDRPNAPRLDPFLYAHDPMIGTDVQDIERKAHEEHVDRAARIDNQPAS